MRENTSHSGKRKNHRIKAFNCKRCSISATNLLSDCAVQSCLVFAVNLMSNWPRTDPAPFLPPIWHQFVSTSFARFLSPIWCQVMSAPTRNRTSNGRPYNLHTSMRHLPPRWTTGGFLIDIHIVSTIDIFYKSIMDVH